MNFAELIAPLSEAQFLADYWGRRPVHLPAPAGSRRQAILDWDRLNRLLAIQPHWTEANIKLLLNSRPVAPDFYMAGEGSDRVASMARVETFLAMGASLVADTVEAIDPQIRDLATMLGQRFAARSGGNIYASFQGIQAFASHCDTHEVFAIHCAGEKTWRLYANRAENPLSTLEGDDAQRRIDAAKGPVMMEVTMRPGDVLYIPRGWFHDAIASAAESLHLTMSVAPHSGRLLFRLFEEMAIGDAAFRDYLPDAREDGGAALRARLADLAARLAGLAATPALFDAVVEAQRDLTAPAPALGLPARPALEFYARSKRPAEIVHSPAGAALRIGGDDYALGPLSGPADYILSRDGFSVQELAARYPQHPREEIDGLIALAERLGLIQRYRPTL